MNLTPEDKLRFCLFRHDGSDFQVIGKEILGSGHPAYEKTGRYICTDAYPREPVTGPGKEVPIRLIDTVRMQQQKVTTIFTLGNVNPSVLRLDPHPAWSRDGTKICFNGAPDGRRQVFVADLKNLLG